MNKRLALSEKTLNGLASKIMSIESLSRVNVERVFSSLPSEKRLLVLNSSNLNYFLAGSNAVRSDLVTHYNSIDFLKDKANRSFMFGKHRQSKQYRKEVFDSFMTALEMPRDSIRRLTDQQILKIRKDSVARRFRRKYRKAISLVREGRVNEGAEFKRAEYDPVEKEIKRVIEIEIEKEIKRDRIVNQVRRAFRKASYVSASLTIAGFAFPLPIPEYATLPLAVYKVIDPFFAKLWDSIGNVEFLVFAAKIGKPRRVPWR